METTRLTKQCHQLESELCDMKLNAISNGNYATESDHDDDEDGEVGKTSFFWMFISTCLIYPDLILITTGIFSTAPHAQYYDLKR